MLSAREHPAFSAGMSTVFSGFKIFAVSAMNLTPQKTIISLYFTIDLESEVISAHRELVTNSYLDKKDKILIVEMDVRRAKWRHILGLDYRTEIHWADVRTLDIKELGSFGYPIIYRLTYGDGWYRGKDGKRHYFPLQPHLVGIDLMRQLIGNISGMALPTLALDGPGGMGKIPLTPDYIISRDTHQLSFRNYRGKLCSYPEHGDPL